MTALTQAQAAAIDTPHQVHGVDADGAYLGLVAGHFATAIASGPPPAYGTWHWQAGVWARVLSIDELRAEAWERIKTSRDAALGGTFACGGLVYDINATNITGATVRAMRAQAVGVPYAQTWVLADNSTTVLDAAGMVAVGEACAAAVNAIWQISIVLRAQIDAATTAADLSAIDWPA